MKKVEDNLLDKDFNPGSMSELNQLGIGYFDWIKERTAVKSYFLEERREHEDALVLPYINRFNQPLVLYVGKKGLIYVLHDYGHILSGLKLNGNGPEVFHNRLLLDKAMKKFGLGSVDVTAPFVKEILEVEVSEGSVMEGIHSMIQLLLFLDAVGSVAP